MDHPRSALDSAGAKIVIFTPDEHRDRVGTPSNVTFWSANVQATYEALKARGVEFVREPESSDWGWYAVFKDSEGNTFVLSSK